MHGEEIIHLRRTLKIEAIFARNKARDYNGCRIVVNVGIEKKLPIKIQIYDWDGQLLESYEYEGLKLNVGLTSFDFDPKNREYSV